MFADSIPFLDFLATYWAVIMGAVLIAVGYGRITIKITNLEKSIMSKDVIEKMIDKKVTGHCPFAEKLTEVNFEKAIDKRIDSHPLIQKYQITDYAMGELKSDVKQIKDDILVIKLSLAKLNGN